MRRGGRPVMSLPASTTRPRSGLSWPPTMLKMVDLPAPFGPMTASSSPASSAKVTSHCRHHAAEGFVQALDRQQAHAAPFALRRRRAQTAPWRASAADDAAREGQHDGDDREAEQQPPDNPSAA